MSVQDGEIIKCASEFNLPDVTIAQNVFYWRAEFTSGASDGQVLTAVNGMLTDFYGAHLAYIANDVSYRASTVSKIAWNATEGQWLTSKVLGTVTCGVTVTNTDDPEPNVVAANITATTERPQTRGRKAIGGLVETAFLDNDLIAAALADMADTAAEWATDLAVAAVGNLIPVIVRVGVDETWDIFSLIASSIAGTMRTRKPGVGA